MIKILLIILIIIVLVLLFNYFNLTNIEKFKISSSGSANIFSGSHSGSQSGQNFLKNSNSVSGIIPNLRLKSQIKSQIKSNNNKINQENLVTSIDNQVLFDNKDYNENLSIDNKDNQYFYTDMINQSNINETAFNVVYSIDPIDYADVKTGLEKCNEECKGVCFENGYDGIATCYPPETQPFDWGTLYKNPTFTYGYNAYGPGNLDQ